MPTVRYRKLSPAAIEPTRAHPGDAGADLHALCDATLRPGQAVAVRTGLAIEIPDGHEGQVRPRSGLAAKHGITVLNTPGTIDAGYRGEVLVLLVNHGMRAHNVHAGDRIAQLVVAPVVACAFESADDLTASERGAGGLGSTGTAPLVTGPQAACSPGAPGAPGAPVATVESAAARLLRLAERYALQCDVSASELVEAAKAYRSARSGG